ncbi:MAG TPA: tetratricopeptide repeat protein [Pyrinomonadaceae bacterium]|nr:tetratricopeptide repeat protein [Pyrinomonadaceae bacterium]
MSFQNRPRRVLPLAFLCALLATVLAFSACNNPGRLKAEYVSRGEAFLKQKRYQEASIEFRNAIQIDEHLAAAHWGLTRAYEGLERYQEAFEELKRTIDLDQNNLEARAKLGNFYILGQPPNLAEAERLAKEVLARNPNFIEGHILMADVLYLQNHQQEALAELNHAIELNPQRVESYLALARYYIKLSDTAKAEETFKKALSINEASTTAHLDFARFLVQMDRPDEAEREFRRAVEIDPADHKLRLTLASFYLINRQYAKAEDAYKALADLEADRPEGPAVLADYYSSVGRFDDSVKIYQDILTKWPDYERAHYRIGEIMLQRGDLVGASAQAQSVLKHNNRDMQALLLRARVRLQSGQAKQAIEDLKEVLKQEPTSRAGLYYMAQAQLADGKIEQARAYAGDLVRFYSDDLPAKLLQVQISLASGDRQSALRAANDLWERLSKAVPDRDTSPQLLDELRVRTLTARGSADLLSNDMEGARRDFEAARQMAPQLPASYVNLASVSLRENKIDEAIGLYEQALGIDNNNYDALNGLVNNVYVTQKQFDRAHSRLSQAISAQPNNASLYFLNGQVYYKEGNAQGAESELRKTLELDSNYLSAYFLLGALYNNTNQQERAIAEYRHVIERNPEDSSAYTLIGMLEESRQNYDAAIESYRKALDIDASAALAANNLAWLYADRNKGNLDEAVRLAQNVVQNHPDEPTFMDTLGWVYYKKGLHVAAVEQFQKVVAKAGQSATYRYHLGVALAGRGDRAGARRELEQALSIGGNNFAEANDARRALHTL